MDGWAAHVPLLATTSTEAFDRAVLVLGALLILGALLAGLARRSFLSLTAVFVVAGFVLGNGGFEVLSFSSGWPSAW